jgi:aminoglycoside phosphotransferase (APT) family kinase protein
MTLQEFLPDRLRGDATVVTKIGVGQSGAGVFRVDVAGRAYVLKVASDAQPHMDWQRRVAILRAAADAGIAAEVIHVDDVHRAVTSAFVTDRSFPALFGTPQTRDTAIELLGRTLRAVHTLPIPDGAAPLDLRGFLSAQWRLASTGGAVPAFAADAVNRSLAEEPPPQDRAHVLSHNDVDPTNLTFDGERLLLLDWDAAGPNDPLYDLATVALFLRMDDAAALRLLAIHDGAPASALPVRFTYLRRFVAVLCGAAFLHLARASGHPGSTTETLDSTPSLALVYQRMRSGAISVATTDGRWLLGLSLIKSSTTS